LAQALAQASIQSARLLGKILPTEISAIPVSIRTVSMGGVGEPNSIWTIWYNPRVAAKHLYKGERIIQLLNKTLIQSALADLSFQPWV
jgi:hypothetical protein